MPFPIGREESYDILRPFLPEDAKRVLEKEIPRIRKQIDGEIDDFVNALSRPPRWRRKSRTSPRNQRKPSTPS